MADRAEGLRERKKRRTRQTIIEVAHELFHAKGFEATTLEEIAAGADVSVRTLFRYFTGKEAIALAPLDEMGDLTVAALRRRPADEPPLAALRAAAMSAWALMSPDGQALRHYADQLLPSEQASPLAGAVLSRLIVIGDRLAMELVDNDEAVDEPRACVEPPPDIPDIPDIPDTPEALAASATGPAARFPAPIAELDAQLTVVRFLSAIQVAIRFWCGSGSTDLSVLLVVVETCLDRICSSP